MQHLLSGEGNLYGLTEALELKNKNKLDATYYFIVLLIGSTCPGCRL